jgi:hypothetical protein
VTEAEWVACADPARMLAYLAASASGRKTRLFATACCRRNWHLLDPEFSRPAVEVIEQYADGLATDRDLANVHLAARQRGRETERRMGSRPSPEADLAYRRSQQFHLVGYAAQANGDLGMVLIYTTQCRLRGVVGYRPVIDREAHDQWHRLVGRDKADLADLVRDVFANPFRPVVVDPGWRTADVLAVARGIYEERAFDRLPLLADALMDAGCADEDVLGHCRSTGPHVRGCWVVDLVLGRG